MSASLSLPTLNATSLSTLWQSATVRRAPVAQKVAAAQSADQRSLRVAEPFLSIGRAAWLAREQVERYDGR